MHAAVQGNGDQRQTASRLDRRIRLSATGLGENPLKFLRCARRGPITPVNEPKEGSIRMSISSISGVSSTAVAAATKRPESTEVPGVPDHDGDGDKAPATTSTTGAGSGSGSGSRAIPGQLNVKA
jgi:hypothetical protein